MGSQRENLYKCISGTGHKTQRATVPIYGKTLRNLLWNQKSYDPETCHAASGTLGLESLCK